MAYVKPFSAIRYDFSRLSSELSAVLAPPYDVLDQADKDALLAKSDRNIVAIDLPHLPPKSAGPESVYLQAAERLEAWLTDGTLMREEKPAIYLYHQVFEYEGKTFTRRKFVARVRLQPFSEGSILPHEKTFGGPKEDRLALMKATKCQLSPIFGLYSDPQDRLGQAFASIASHQPDAVGRVRNTESRVWIVCEPSVLDRVVSEMAERKIYIADGHHRYDTALMYRDFVTKQNGRPLADDHPANYIMFVLASMDDPGCLILPYHRVVGGINLEELLNAWKEGVQVSSSGEETDLILFDGLTGKQTAVCFTKREALRTLEPHEVSPWYDLDYAYLHRYLIDEWLTKKRSHAPDIHYVKSVANAKQTAREVRGVALLTRAVPMAQLRAVSEAGGLMPQKSTYFHPKLATGIAINPLV